ncbi:hypothetical protein GGH94_004273 [Coemansia aciculifera]|uniref:Zn(2)-C6 fungal-type domain-containing protein n=1 Tax=Coemansia aciculifera TaxID=417176 RepID=A0A9W8IFL8_9FUNG|nr:hypothetical protein GGH94_004273 [Coemansia aciculifera]
MLPQSTEQPLEERPPVARLVPHTTATPLPSIPPGAVDVQGAQQRALLLPPPPPQSQPHQIRLGHPHNHNQQEALQSPTVHDHTVFSPQGEPRRNNGKWYPPQQHQHNHYYQHQQQQQQQQPQSQHHPYPRPLADATSPGTGNHHYQQQHPRPLSGDRAEGVKRLRSEHSHSLNPSASSSHHGQEEGMYSYSAYSSAPLHNDVAVAAPSSLTPPMPPMSTMPPARLQMRSASVSISPVPSSSAHLSRGIPDNGPRIPQAPNSATVAAPHPAASLNLPQSMRPVVAEDQRLNGDQRRQVAGLSDDDNDNKGDDAHDIHEGEEADHTTIDSSTSRSNHHRHEMETASRLEQKRRLNQACLLCRRKKIRCDSSQPSCSNCQRRGIQCIYPEVRKRGRPPRMYTFADFALPGQPLPPELHGIANVHASAMLPPAAGGFQGSSAGHNTSNMPAWRQVATEYTAGHLRGPDSAAGMSGTSTPAYTLSEYDQSPALPPLSVAMGRGGQAHQGMGGYHTMGRGSLDPMLLPTPPLGVDQAVLDLFEYITPGFPIVHRQTLVQNIRDRSLTLPLWLAIHAVSARFETHHGGRALGQNPQHPLPPSTQQRLSGPALGAGYAEKTHAMLVNRFGHRQPRPVWGRNERGRMVVGRDPALEHGEAAGSDLSRREVVELLQTHILLSIYYAGNWELELAVETHAAAVRIAQRMGVHLIDDPSRLPDASGIFNPTAAQHQRKRAQDWSSPACGPSYSSSRWQANAGSQQPLPGGPNDIEVSNGHLNDSSASADIRKNWIEYETLRRIWWSMFILDRTYYMCAGSPRMIHISGFRVRLPCNDLEWDSMHAQPTSGSPTAAASLTMPDSGQQPSGLMVRTFREAVMHTSLSEQAANEIAATPSADPHIYRYAAALAGLIDSIMDFGEDIRALATPPLMEGTEILAQLRAEQLGTSSGGQYSQKASTAVWLGSRNASKQYAWAGRSGWHSSSVSAAWPPDWRSRMRVLQERAAGLEARFTEWYSSMPIAQYARKPYLYSQLPLQDRITYFHQQIVYYGGVIQLQSLIVMAQGLLLPDPVDDGSAAFGPSALTNMLWRSLMDIDVAQQLAGDIRSRRPTGDSVSSDPMYASRRRQFGGHSGWTPRRQYGVGNTLGTEGPLNDGGAAVAGDDSAPLVPLDEDGNSPELIREELQRMVQAAWCRCTEAAIAMSSAVKRATEVRKIASANPNTTYYDPTFRPQVLPPYRGEVVSGEPSAGPTYGASGRYERAPMAGEMRASPQQPHMSTMSMHGLAEGLSRSPLPPPPTTHSPYQPQEHSKSPRVANPGMVVDSAAGPGQVIDDATFFMRFNMFTCSAAYIGACIHLQNLKVTPRWELAIRRHNEAMAKLSDARATRGVGITSSSMAEDRDMGMLSSPQDIGVLPPPPPPPLPALPCTPDQARDGVKTLVKILEGISPYWRVGSRVDRIRTMWREIEGSDLLPSAQVLASPSARIPGPPPMPMPQPPMPSTPMSGMETGQWVQRSPVSSRHHRQHRPPSQSPPPPPPPILHHQQPPPQSLYNNSSMSIAAISSDLPAQPPSMPVHSRQPSAVGPLPPQPSSSSMMMMSSRQNIGMPPPPRP